MSLTKPTSVGKSHLIPSRAVPVRAPKPRSHDLHRYLLTPVLVRPSGTTSAEPHLGHVGSVT